MFEGFQGVSHSLFSQSPPKLLGTIKHAVMCHSRCFRGSVTVSSKPVSQTDVYVWFFFIQFIFFFNSWAYVFGPTYQWPLHATKTCFELQSFSTPANKQNWIEKKNQTYTLYSCLRDWLWRDCDWPPWNPSNSTAHYGIKESKGVPQSGLIMPRVTE